MKKLVVTIFFLILISISKISYADERIHVNWPDKGSIFHISNAVPGDVFNRTLPISGKQSGNHNYFFRIRIITDEHNLSKVLLTRLSQQNKIIYEGSLKALAHKVNGVQLESIDSKNGENINVSLTFDRNAGNNFQNSAVSFIGEIGSEEITHKKNETVWEKCKKYLNEVKKKTGKVSDKRR